MNETPPPCYRVKLTLREGCLWPTTGLYPYPPKGERVAWMPPQADLDDARATSEAYQQLFGDDLTSEVVEYAPAPRFKPGDEAWARLHPNGARGPLKVLDAKTVYRVEMLSGMRVELDADQLFATEAEVVEAAREPDDPEYPRRITPVWVRAEGGGRKLSPPHKPGTLDPSCHCETCDAARATLAEAALQ